MPLSTAERPPLAVLRNAGLLALSSLLSIIYQTSIAQQYCASVLELRSGFQIVFGLVHVFYGAGMYLAWRLFRAGYDERRMRLLWAISAACILASLVTTQLSNPHGEYAAFIVTAGVVLVSAALTLFGMVFSGILVWFHQHHRRQVGLAVAVSLLGLVVAFVIRAPLVIHLGNSSLLVLVSLLCLAPALPRVGGWVALALAFAAALTPGLDQRIERLRDTTNRMDMHSYLDYLPKEEMATFESILDVWSPYAKINLFEVPGTPRLGGVYNYYVTWIFDDRPDRRRELFYSFIEPDDEVLCIAIGGGWPLLAIPVQDRSQITGVELDPVVVEFFQRNPEYNDNLFNEIQVVRAEGRAALETLEGPYDAIVIDLPGSPATQKENPVEFENLLLTVEGIEAAMGLLSPDGVLVTYLLPHQIGSAYAVAQASDYAVSLLVGPAGAAGGDRYHSLNKTYALYLSRDSQRLRRFENRVLALGEQEGGIISAISDQDHAKIADSPISTDDRPYAQMQAYLEGRASRERRTGTFEMVFKSAKVSLAALALFSVLAVLLRGRDNAERKHLVFFWAIGVGMVMLQLYLYARFRSFFGDPVSTTMMATLLLFLANAAGSLLANAFEARTPSWWVRVLGTLLLLAYTHAAIELVPFGIAHPILRFLVAGAVIVPFGVASGVFFPVGVMRVPLRSYGWSLALDGAGTFVGFLGFYFLAWNYGIAATMLPIAASYALAALLLTRR
jgi:hypothetical protein